MVKQCCDSITNNIFTQVTPLRFCFPHKQLNLTLLTRFFQDVRNPMVIQSEAIPILAVSNIPSARNDRRSSHRLLSQPSIWQVSDKAPYETQPATTAVPKYRAKFDHISQCPLARFGPPKSRGDISLCFLQSFSHAISHSRLKKIRVWTGHDTIIKESR